MVKFFNLEISFVNLQALVALISFISSLFLSRLAAKIMRGELKASHVFLIYLRALIGFTLVASIYLGLYSLIGQNVLFK